MHATVKYRSYNDLSFAMKRGTYQDMSFVKNRGSYHDLGSVKKRGSYHDLNTSIVKKRGSCNDLSVFRKRGSNHDLSASKKRGSYHDMNASLKRRSYHDFGTVTTRDINKHIETMAKRRSYHELETPVTNTNFLESEAKHGSFQNLNFFLNSDSCNDINDGLGLESDIPNYMASARSGSFQELNKFSCKRGSLDHGLSAPSYDHGSYRDLSAEDTWKIKMFLDSTEVSYCEGEVEMELQNSINNNLNLVPHTGHPLLNCGICHNSYSNPKVLPCLHSFCEQCLHEYIPAESLSVTCPVCRQQSILPLDGVGALQANIFITSLMEVVGPPDICGLCSGDQEKPTTKCTTCDKFVCLNCVKQHGEDDNLKGHNLVSVPACSSSEESEDSTLVCPNHDGNPLQFYCSSCETGVCQDCTTVEHLGHTIIALREAVTEHKTSLDTLIKGARGQVPQLQEAINNITEITQSLTNQTKIAESKVIETFDDLIGLMTDRKMALLKDLNNVYSKKTEVLQKQKENIESVITKIENCCEFTEETLEHGVDTEVLLVRKEVTNKLQEFATDCVRKEPEDNEFVSFDTAHCQGLKKSLGNLGYIKHNSAIGYNTSATGEGLRHAFVNKPAVIHITTKDRSGDLVKVGHSVIDSELTASNGDRIIPAITDQQNGTYELVYLLPREDNYVMFIKLFGRHIKGSPFKIKAVNISADDHGEISGSSSKIPRTAAVKQKGTKRPSSSRSGSNRKSNLIEDDMLWRVGVKGRNKGEFTNPQGVCCTDSKILVADSNNQVVQLFTLSGDCKLRFGSPGRIAGKLQRPTGVAVTLNGNYLVADYDNKWISVFAPDGKYLNKIGTGKLLGPKGIAVDRNGHIIVVDNKASTIFIFQPNGKLLSKFGSRGNGDHQFAGPHFVAVNASNDIIVSDFHNHCIKVFDCEGNFLFCFGSNGEGNGQFNAPTGVAVDDFGNILVADWGNSRIQVFDSNGSFLSYVNTAADPLYGPQGLAITPDGTVVVADSGNHCIKVYKYLQ